MTLREHAGIDLRQVPDYQVKQPEVRNLSLRIWAIEEFTIEYPEVDDGQAVSRAGKLLMRAADIFVNRRCANELPMRNPRSSIRFAHCHLSLRPIQL
jgi:hypothetical protein